MRKIWFLLLVLTTGLATLNGQTDSLRVEREGDAVFVIHKVASKQTLFSLARRYGTTVAAITKENPTVSNGLQVGQELKIPYGKALITSANLTHTVKSGETLFAIASKYGVKIDEIKELNSLTANSLSVGQVLVIKKDQNAPIGSLPEEVPDDSVVIEPVITGVVDQPADTAVSREPKTPEISVPDPSDELSSSPFKEVKVENVVAELIEEGEATTKFLALHRTAVKGTVIKVRNVMNDLTVYVRVVGKLLDTGSNAEVEIKINKRAYDQLKALDKRFRVDLSYFN